MALMVGGGGLFFGSVFLNLALHMSFSLENNKERCRKKRMCSSFDSAYSSEVQNWIFFVLFSIVKTIHKYNYRSL